MLSSRWESLPLGLIEAMAAGAPIVAADRASGPRQVLEDGDYGRLVPMGDVTAPATALAERLTEPEHLKRPASGGPAGVAERYDPTAAAIAHRAVLRALTESRPIARTLTRQRCSSHQALVDRARRHCRSGR